MNILNGDSNIVDSYYLTSTLSYESDRCLLHGHSIMHYIVIVLKWIIKKILRIIVRIVFQLLLNPYTYLLLAVLFVIYAYILPVIKRRWREINTLVCKVEDFHTPRIATPDITNPIGIGPSILFNSHELISAKYPFAGMFNIIFGEGTFDCTPAGDSWNNVEYGSCGQRFGGENPEITGCNSSFATDYSLWNNDSNEGIEPGHKVCNNKIFCINSPENYIIANTSVADFTPIINTGINKGTSPFKYLACCSNSGQRDKQGCSDIKMEQAKNSINFANKFPKYGMDRDEISYVNERNYLNAKIGTTFPDEGKRVIWPWDIWTFWKDVNNVDKEYGNFKPISMYQATMRYFYPVTTWNRISDNKFECLQGSTSWLSKTIWILIVIFLIYELYYFIYDISYAEKMHKDYKANKDKNGNCKDNLVKNVNKYLCNKSFEDNEENCHNDKVKKAVEKFKEHIGEACSGTHPHQKDKEHGESNEGGFFKKFMNSHKFHKNGCKIIMDNKNKKSHGSHDIMNSNTNECAKAKGLDPGSGSDPGSGIQLGTDEIDILHIQLLFGFMIISCILTYIIVYIINNKKRKKHKNLKDKQKDKQKDKDE